MNTLFSHPIAAIIVVAFAVAVIFLIALALIKGGHRDLVAYGRQTIDLLRHGAPDIYDRVRALESDVREGECTWSEVGATETDLRLIRSMHHHHRPAPALAFTE